MPDNEEINLVISKSSEYNEAYFITFKNLILIFKTGNTDSIGNIGK